MLTEGYRWGGYCAAWHLWLGGEGGPSAVGREPAARRAWCGSGTGPSGPSQKVKRTFGIFNDTQYPEPITFSRRLTRGGQGGLRENLHPQRRPRHGA